MAQSHPIIAFFPVAVCCCGSNPLDARSLSYQVLLSNCILKNDLGIERNERGDSNPPPFKLSVVKQSITFETFVQQWRRLKSQAYIITCSLGLMHPV